MQVSGERAKSANTRHECFVMDASVSVKTAETAELDDLEQPAPTAPRLLHRPGESERVASVRRDASTSSKGGARATCADALAFRFEAAICTATTLANLLAMTAHPGPC
jgi:hypothetical protein